MLEDFCIFFVVGAIGFMFYLMLFSDQSGYVPSPTYTVDEFLDLGVCN